MTAATAALILATSRSHLLTRILQERNNRAAALAAFQSDLSSVEKPISLEQPQTSSQSAFQSPSLQVSPVIKDDQETLKAEPEPQKSTEAAEMLFEVENHQMAPLVDQAVAPPDVKASNQEPFEATNSKTGNESWIAVAETDALRRAEADAEASFMVQPSSAASPVHHSTQTSGTENNNPVVHHHHHHHHHHYHHHHHSLSLGTKKEDQPQPPIEHPDPPTPPINKTPLRALINSALVDNSATRKPFPRKLARSNTTLDANLTSSTGKLTSPIIANSSQPGSPQIRALKSLRTQSQEENHPPASNHSNSPNNSTGPSTPTNKDKMRSSSKRQSSNYSTQQSDPNLIRTDKTFDMEQMNRSLEVIKRTGSSKKSSNHHQIDQQLQNSSEFQQNGSSNTLMNQTPTPSAPPPVAAPVKNAKYKKLWGKVGKHGMMKAAEAATTNDSSGGSSGSTSGSKKDKKKSGWDALLNPVMQKQRQSMAREANYHFHVQQVQLGEACAGSGWTGANMECDCGEDSCPRCNLLLSMDDPSAQW